MKPWPSTEYLWSNSEPPAGHCYICPCAVITFTPPPGLSGLCLLTDTNSDTKGTSEAIFISKQVLAELQSEIKIESLFVTFYCLQRVFKCYSQSTCFSPTLFTLIFSWICLSFWFGLVWFILWKVRGVVSLIFWFWGLLFCWVWFFVNSPFH